MVEKEALLGVVVEEGPRERSVHCRRRFVLLAWPMIGVRARLKRKVRT